MMAIAIVMRLHGMFYSPEPHKHPIPGNECDSDDFVVVAIINYTNNRREYKTTYLVIQSDSPLFDSSMSITISTYRGMVSQINREYVHPDKYDVPLLQLLLLWMIMMTTTVLWRYSLPDSPYSTSWYDTIVKIHGWW